MLANISMLKHSHAFYSGTNAHTNPVIGLSCKHQLMNTIKEKKVSTRGSQLTKSIFQKATKLRVSVANGDYGL